VTPKIGDDGIVVEQRIVDVEQEHEIVHSTSGHGAFAYPDRNGVTTPVAGSNR
jgi:hypothetical protein